MSPPGADNGVRQRPNLAAHSGESDQQLARQVAVAKRRAGHRAAVLTVALHQHGEVFNRDLSDAAAVSCHQPGIDNVALGRRDVWVLEQAPHVDPAFKTPRRKCGHRT
jgi:hypothetical protein